MDTQTIYKNHISIDQNYILKFSIKNPLKDKEDFIKILKCWVRYSNSETIGDLTKMNGNTPLIHLVVGSSNYYLNADSKRTGVEEFLNNKDASWKIILNEVGVKNKVTNREDKEAIPLFYFYKEI
jgi:hypothetical protein